MKGEDRMLKKVLFTIGVIMCLISVNSVFAEDIQVSYSRVPLKINSFDVESEYYKILTYNDMIYVPIYTTYYNGSTLFQSILNVGINYENLKTEEEPIFVLKDSEIPKSEEGGEEFLFNAEEQTFSYKYLDGDYRYQYGKLYTCSASEYFISPGNYINEIVQNMKPLERKVYMCGRKYENSEYPFLMSTFDSDKYSVIYMPLTYEIGKMLGWNMNYDPSRGMAIYINGHSSCYYINNTAHFGGMLGSEEHMFTSGTTSIKLDMALYPYPFENRHDRVYITENNGEVKEIPYKGEWILGCRRYYGGNRGAYTFGATLKYENRKLTINGVKLIENEDGFEETTADIVIDVDTGEELEVKNIQVNKFAQWKAED